MPRKCTSKALVKRTCQAAEESFKLKLAGEGNLSPPNSYQFDASASNRCPEPGEGSQVSGRAPEEQHKGIATAPASISASAGTQLKCCYASTHTTGNKQEELEMYTYLQGYNFIGIMEMWWDGSYAWCVDYNRKGR